MVIGCGNNVGELLKNKNFNNSGQSSKAYFFSWVEGVEYLKLFLGVDEAFIDMKVTDSDK